MIIGLFQGEHESQASVEGANIEEMLISMLDERDRLMEGLRDAQNQLSDSRTRLSEVERERDVLNNQLTSCIPQVGFIIYIL